MKTIKCMLFLGAGASLSLLLTKPVSGQTVRPAGTKEKKEVHISIVDDQDGQVRRIDTTFEAGPDFDMNEWMKANNIKMPPHHEEAGDFIISGESKEGEPGEIVIKTPPGAHRKIMTNSGTMEPPCEPGDKDCVLKWLESDSMVKVFSTLEIDDLPEGQELRVMRKGDGKKSEVMINRVIVRKVETTSKTSVKEAKALDAVIFPNPSAGEFTIDITVPGKTPATLEIKDKDGKVIYSESVKSSGKLEVDLSSKGKGTYFLNLKQGKKTIQRQIVVN